VDSSEIGQHLIQGGGVDLAVHPAGTVGGHLPEPMLQIRDESIVAVKLAGERIVGIVVLQPQGDVPGLPVCPSVVGGHGLILWLIRLLYRVRHQDGALMDSASTVSTGSGDRLGSPHPCESRRRRTRLP